MNKLSFKSLMNPITREEFIDWFIQMLRTDKTEQIRFIGAIKVNLDHAISAFIHGFYAQWRHSAPVALGRPLREIVEVGQLGLDIVARVQEVFKEQFTAA